MIRAAQLLLVAAALALWGASRVPWVVLRWFDELAPPRTATLDGAQWSTALVPMAVLLLAAALAALAVRGWVLRGLSVLAAVVSAGALYLGGTLWVVRDVAVRAAYLADVPLAMLVSSERKFTGAVLTVAAGIACLAASVLLMRAAAKPATSAVRYATPAQRRAVQDRGVDGQTMTERTMWDALDEGKDPTHESDTEGR